MIKIKYHKYQQKAIRFCVARGAGGLFMAPGLGKTLCMLTVFDILRKKKMVRSMLIIAPRRPVHLVWPKEIKKWGLKCSYAVLHGKDKDLAFEEDAEINIVTFEGLPWLLDKMKRYKRSYDMLVVDESSKVKNPRSIRFKTLKKMLNKFSRRYILTGSPAANSMLDLFAQIYVLDQGNALGRFKKEYCEEFFYPSGFKGYDWRLQKGADERIYKRLKQLVIRFGEEELDLPPITYRNHYVELPDKARKLYDELEKEFFSTIGSHTITALTAATLTQKLRQVSNGGAITDRGTKVIHEAKIEAMKDIVEELSGQPILIAYEFKQDLAMLRKALGRKVPYIGGGVSDKECNRIESAWNNGEIPILLGQPQSVALGLNLQDGPCSTIAWYAQTWSYHDYDQFIRRIWRQGQNRHVIVHHIVAIDTVDSAILNALKAKAKTQDKLFKALSVYAKGRGIKGLTRQRSTTKKKSSVKRISNKRK